MLLHSCYCTHANVLLLLHSCYCTHATALMLLHSCYCTHATVLMLLYTATVHCYCTLLMYSCYCTHATVHCYCTLLLYTTTVLILPYSCYCTHATVLMLLSIATVHCYCPLLLSIATVHCSRSHRSPPGIHVGGGILSAHVAFLFPAEAPPMATRHVRLPRYAHSGTGFCVSPGGTKGYGRQGKGCCAATDGYFQPAERVQRRGASACVYDGGVR
jgi:hypothetical protein